MKGKLKGGIATFAFALTALISSRFLVGNSDNELEERVEYAFSDEVFENRDIIEVDGGDLSGDREANVAVDVGYGDREYWAFTNEHAQLIMVRAKEVRPQNDRVEPVTKRGRYYKDEARVKGTELKAYDQGHVLADSLGGVANAYNITPQDSYVNRRGEQAIAEERIRKNRGCTDFVCFITYPNNKTTIPSKYLLIYKINGKIFSSEFKNGK